MFLLQVILQAECELKWNFFGSNSLNVKIKRSEKTKNKSFVGEWCKVMYDNFFPRQTQMFLELLSSGTSLTLFITFNKTAQEFSFFFSSEPHKKSFQWRLNDLTMTCNWFFFIIDQFVCKTIILGNFIRYWQYYT